MRAWQLRPGFTTLEGLQFLDLPKPVPGPNEVLVRVRACSLNYRDQLIIAGKYSAGGPLDQALVPLSDGVGEVEAVGSAVTRYRAGDRVASCFFQAWEAGPANARQGAALGAPPAKGMLAEYVTLPETGIVPMANSLSFEEAATLPCAGVTAWNALMAGPKPVVPGRTVLLLGTGGVSLLALQIAQAAGARVILTSSDDAKLARARALGADELINYRTTPGWGAAVAQLTGGGVDHVVEVGGAGTLGQSVAAVACAGEIALIGVLAREGATHPIGLMFKGATLRGIFVGSAAMARDLNLAIDRNGIKPVVDRVFALEDAVEAYRYQATPALFGKVVIRL
jgi:NADPH:quinone reductase-like Zn-dependent oxidoreductase